MKLLSDKPKGFVRKIGFESFLSMSDFQMNKALALWLVDKFNCDTEALEFEGDISILVRPPVKCVLGIPSGPIQVVRVLDLDNCLYNKYSCNSSAKNAKTVAKEMCSITEEEPFCISFMMAILAMYLAPNTTPLVDRSFLGAAQQVRRLDESVYAPVLNSTPNGNTVEGGSRADSDTNTDGLADQFAIIDTDHNNNHRPVSAEHGNATTTPNTASSAIVLVPVVLDTSAQSAVAAPGSSTERTIFPASGEQLKYSGSSSIPYTAQITDGTQVTPNATIGRNKGSPSMMEKDDPSAKKSKVELPSNGQVKRAGEVTLKMDMSLLNCRVCSRPIKPPVFQCNAGHLACGRCLAELPGEQCQTCEHGGGFIRSPMIDAVVSSLTVMCGHDSCGSDVPYNELDDHQSKCQHAPCFCMEPGCGFFGAPLALLSHMGTLHEMPVHKVHYGNIHQLRLSERQPRCLLHGQGDGSVFLLVMGALGVATVVSVVCIRAGASSWPQYAVELRANGPPPPSSIEGSILLDMKPVTSSTRPGEVTVVQLPSFLGVPPTYLAGSGSSKEVSLDVRIDRM